MRKQNRILQTITTSLIYETFLMNKEKWRLSYRKVSSHYLALNFIISLVKNNFQGKKRTWENLWRNIEKKCWPYETDPSSMFTKIFYEE